MLLRGKYYELCELGETGCCIAQNKVYGLKRWPQLCKFRAGTLAKWMQSGLSREISRWHCEKVL